nr:MAG TPA: hypothetical protein [Caudoviricetes sp.]
MFYRLISRYLYDPQSRHRKNRTCRYKDALARPNLRVYTRCPTSYVDKQHHRQLILTHQERRQSAQCFS